MIHPSARTSFTFADRSPLKHANPRTPRTTLIRLRIALMALASAATFPLSPHAVAAAAVAPADPYLAVIPDLDRWIAAELAAKKLPGLSIALVDDQRLIWSKGFGLADPKRGILASPDTAYRVGSVSKLFTDIAVMQLVEQGLVDLDAPVQKLLPDFAPQNPYGTPITLRHLLSHRSGLVREPPVGHYFDPTCPSLVDVVRSLSRTTLVHAPGTTTKYSNAAITVVGAIIQKVRSQPFAQAVNQSLLTPLEMRQSSFEPDSAFTSKMAQGAMWTPDGRVVVTPTFLLGTGPAGNLVSSVSDLAKFLSFLFAEGRGPSGPLLKSATLHSMIQPEPTAAGKPSNFGLGFAVSTLDGHPRIGHSGAVYGFATDLQALPDQKLGAVVIIPVDCANGIAQHIAATALRSLVAVKANRPFSPPPISKPLALAHARQLRGHYVHGDKSLELDEQSGKLLLLAVGGFQAVELRSLGDQLIVDDPLIRGPLISTAPGELTVSGEVYSKRDTKRPDNLNPRWHGLIGEYGWDHDVLYILERNGKLSALIEWFFEYPLTEESPDHFRFPADGLYANESLTFARDASGQADHVDVANVTFARRHLDGEGDATFRVKPVRSVNSIRSEFQSAKPPVEHGQFVQPQLVEITKREPSIRLDIRYATTNNFLGVPLYTTARAFLQRPAAEAVVRAHHGLQKHGYQLLIHDAYRPWSVTKLFWEAVPSSGKGFVADPAKGSKHNRGAAVDLTLFSLVDNAPARMPGGYDEFSPRSHPYYPGGTSRQRWQRNLLRYAMEAEGFTVNSVEWWHFDYKGWEHFPVLDLDFNRVDSAPIDRQPPIPAPTRPSVSVPDLKRKTTLQNSPPHAYPEAARMMPSSTHESRLVPKVTSMKQFWNTVALMITTLSFPLLENPPAHGAEPAKSAVHHLGLLGASQTAQREAEQKAVAIPTPDNARKWLRVLTAEPHVAGTPADYKTAIFVRDKLREWGWKAELQELEVLLNYPLKGHPPTLSLTEPVQKPLSTNELPVAIDKDSASSDAFGAFHGYGVSGTAAGQVVYVNYGRPEDYTELEELGIEVKDKIVLARYGSLFRGLKVRNAQKRGARGILIFSDPADDGYAKGDVYPDGRFRPGSAIQRGSVQFLSLGPGDPSTPSGPSTVGAKRLPIDSFSGFPLEPASDAMNPSRKSTVVADWEKSTGFKRDDYFATIPSLPISYDNALEILKQLAGPSAPDGWQGGLPIPYHVGPGPAELTFTILHDYQIRKIWNVIASIPGEVEPDRWVMISNHRDAWVYGAVDPGSGTAATLETCRALGAAVKQGWKPRRSLYYASWDAEEYGLVGSTEWGEEHASEIQQKVVMLLNVDSAVSGPELSLAGIPSLRDLMLESAASINDARTGKSLRQLWTQSRQKAWSNTSPLVLADPFWQAIARAQSKDSKPTLQPKHDFCPQMESLGSGSDFTVFVDHLGVPSVDVGFSGGYGVYHSMYDNFTWMEKFGDPEFLSHATSARLYTQIAMRAAGADILPFTFTPYARALRDHVDQLRLIHLHSIRKASPPVTPADTELTNITTLADAVWLFETKAERLDHALTRVNSLKTVDSSALVRLNDALNLVERAFLLKAGLPERPWFKHAVYAPGLTTGYAAWPFPAVRGAVEEKSAAKLASAISDTSDRIHKAADALQVAQELAEAIVEKARN